MGAKQPVDDLATTPRQQHRARALRRFNVQYVYAPIGIVATAALVVTGLLFALALSGESADRRPELSAAADAIILLAALPAVLVCAIGPAGAIAIIFVILRKERAPIGTIHRISWRIENFITSVGNTTQRISERAVRPLIWLHARAAQLDRLLSETGRILKRSK